jgi:hypothetical protein
MSFVIARRRVYPILLQNTHKLLTQYPTIALKWGFLPRMMIVTGRPVTRAKQMEALL